MTGCSTLSQPEKQQFPQPQANLIIPCKQPNKIPSKGSSYREIEEWSVDLLTKWAMCARDKQALVNSWPK